MRILVHEYVGYAFPLQLSKTLASRGHQVQHVYSSSFQSPKGSLVKESDDPETLEIIPLRLKKPFQKYSFIARRFQEVEYGKLVAKQIALFEPHVVISADTPIEAQATVLRESKRIDAQFLFWLQDVYSLAAYQLLRKHIPIFGELVGRYYMWLEQRLLRRSDKVILIADDFEPLMVEWQIDLSKTCVIGNWGPVNELLPDDKINQWSIENQLADKFCFVYSGTLGMKHNPAILVELAKKYREYDDVRVVVVSQGLGADWLHKQKHEQNLDNLILLDFQPYEQLSNILATADVLIAVLEPEAGSFSVPSKVLTYFCAQRPLLTSMPLANAAARMVSKNNAGFVSAPGDISSLLSCAERLRSNDTLRRTMASNARQYAMEHFDIDVISNKFEDLFLQPSAKEFGSDSELSSPILTQ